MIGSDLTDEEFAVLKVLIGKDCAVISNAVVEASLVAKGYVRLSGDVASITVGGCRQYLLQLPSAFGSELG